MTRKYGKQNRRKTFDKFQDILNMNCQQDVQIEMFNRQPGAVGTLERYRARERNLKIWA